MAVTYLFTSCDDSARKYPNVFAWIVMALSLGLIANLGFEIHLTFNETSTVKGMRGYNFSHQSVQWSFSKSSEENKGKSYCILTWLLKWLPHRWSKSQSHQTVLLRTTSTQMIIMYMLLTINTLSFILTFSRHQVSLFRSQSITNSVSQNKFWKYNEHYS